MLLPYVAPGRIAAPLFGSEQFTRHSDKVADERQNGIRTGKRPWVWRSTRPRHRPPGRQQLDEPVHGREPRVMVRSEVNRLAVLARFLNTPITAAVTQFVASGPPERPRPRIAKILIGHQGG
jgi:hypothetical protein